MPNMGMHTSTTGSAQGNSDSEVPAGLADALFTHTQQRLLALLFGQPERSYYTAELIALAGAGSGAIQRELARWTISGLLHQRISGSQKHYQANPDSPIFTELCGIARKTVGLAQPLRNALAPVHDRIRAAFVYGSVAKRQDTATSDIDLLLLSENLQYGDLYTALETLGTQLGRSVNPTLLTQAEFIRRRDDHEAFLTRVLAQPRIWVIGDEHTLAI